MKLEGTTGCLSHHGIFISIHSRKSKLDNTCLPDKMSKSCQELLEVERITIKPAVGN